MTTLIRTQLTSIVKENGVGPSTIQRNDVGFLTVDSLKELLARLEGDMSDRLGHFKASIERMIEETK